MIHSRALVLFIGVLLVPIVTASAAAQGDPTKLDTMKVVEQAKEARPSRTMITAQEIERKSFANPYEAVESLRPAWLRLRGTTHLSGGAGATPIRAYLDNVKLGNVEELKTVDINTVKRLTFLSGAEAQQRFGVGHESGVVLAETMIPIRKDP